MHAAGQTWRACPLTLTRWRRPVTHLWRRLEGDDHARHDGDLLDERLADDAERAADLSTTVSHAKALARHRQTDQASSSACMLQGHDAQVSAAFAGVLGLGGATHTQPFIGLKLILHHSQMSVASQAHPEVRDLGHHPQRRPHDGRLDGDGNVGVACPPERRLQQACDHALVCAAVVSRCPRNEHLDGCHGDHKRLGRHCWSHNQAVPVDPLGDKLRLTPATPGLCHDS